MIFKWRQIEPAIILCAVRWYLRYSLSLRDVEELLEERCLEADHTTVWRWVQRYGPELQQRLRRHLKPTNKSWRVDETYIRVKGHWCYLYRAIDSAGATIDFLLSAKRDAAAAKRLFRKALRDRSHPHPRVINTDLAPVTGDLESSRGQCCNDAGARTDRLNEPGRRSPRRRKSSRSLARSASRVLMVSGIRSSLNVQKHAPRKEKPPIRTFHVAHPVCREHGVSCPGFGTLERMPDCLRDKLRP